MSVIVSDASPLINLARVGRFDLLRHFYTDVIIPPQVYEEVVSRGCERDGSKDVRESTFIRRVAPQDQLAVDALSAELDMGEAAVIILGREVRADALLIDEVRGRRVAQRLGLAVTGTLGILARARRENLIPRLQSELDRLRQRGTWIDERIYWQVLQLVGEVTDPS